MASRIVFKDFDPKKVRIGPGDYVIDNPGELARAHLYRVEVVRLVLRDVEDNAVTDMPLDQVAAVTVETVEVDDPIEEVSDAEASPA